MVKNMWRQGIGAMRWGRIVMATAATNTLAPWYFAIWIANVPIPIEPPWTWNIISPHFTIHPCIKIPSG